ncbi:pilus assembly FimT family protein [Litorilituus lipolyticus]|uniref:Type II secretion system protein n=1 Tax=Litorilituus lipolyticus TaxID=2491017 RepID=A0A502L793_9GAMM|nr:type II secretion system protein [Litorilituus lipolyticus]TPH18974.1 type II secretion system protein [Litorilituus lipolyticus]
MSHSSSAGFTLIELLVVIVIMTTLFTFVSPLGVKQIDRAKAQQELHETIRIFQMLSTRAYASGAVIEVELSNKRIIARYLTKVKTWQFEKLSFTRQIITLNRNGYMDKGIISYSLSGETQQLNMMAELIDNDGVYTYAP